MRKRSIVIYLVVFLSSFLGLWIVLNMQVTTKQAINYEVKTYSIPLYLKGLNFITRHYSYHWLLDQILAESEEKQEVLQIWNWTTQNIADQPDELPVIDDHVWDIIVRGYGKPDQRADVFATLCNYAGFPSGITRLTHESQEQKMFIAFVKINEKWYLFDPALKTFFEDKNGNMLPCDSLNKTPFQLSNPGIDINHYKGYLPSIDEFDPKESYRQNRSAIQSPVARLKAYF